MSIRNFGRGVRDFLLAVVGLAVIFGPPVLLVWVALHFVIKYW